MKLHPDVARHFVTKPDELERIVRQEVDATIERLGATLSEAEVEAVRAEVRASIWRAASRS